MALRIQTNIAAMNAHRQMGITDNAMSKSLERLSSGYRINSAKDDTAGLAIANSMRADTASLKVASRNTSEANSLLQVAAGGLDQISNMLTRLKELATQAASANASSNLAKINSEADKIISEIDRIAESTEYADTKLLNGTFGVTSLTSSTLLTATGYSGISGMVVDGTYTLESNAASMELSHANGTQMITGVSAPSAGSTKEIEFDSIGVTITINSDFGTATDGNITASSAGASSFQVGAENISNNRLSVSLNNVTEDYLGATAGTAISAIDLTSVSNAQTALDTIDDAISDLSTAQGSIGAYQNRLSFAAANLATITENMSAAESVIRDVDMAFEMTEFTKNQILTQAGTAMLAQANMAPQQVLSLFQ